MRDDYSLHTLIFKATDYRDESAFRPSEQSKLKSKRWEVHGLERNNDYVEGVNHPDDEFMESQDTTSFTEWRKESEDFDPHEFLLRFVENFEILAEQNENFRGYQETLRFAEYYGNHMNETLCDDDTIDTIILFGEMYGLPSLNILPFKKAKDLYWEQCYLFYSNCKLITSLFNFKYWGMF